MEQKRAEATMPGKGEEQSAPVVRLRCTGPYTWQAGPKCVFDAAGDTGGIYLWTVSYKGGFLVYYVGETGRSFNDRLTEHASDYLRGHYRIWDAKAFVRGEKVLVWGGMWDKKSPNRIADYIGRFPELSAAVHELLALMRLFLIPIDADTRLRRRIEAAVALDLRSTRGVVGQFQDPDIVYHPRRDEEPPVTVELTTSVKIHGLKNEFQA